MMMSVLTYLIQSSFLLILFYIFYKWIYSKETFYRLNRALLLLMLSGSIVLPLLPWGWILAASDFANTSNAISEALLTVTLQDVVVTNDHSFDWGALLIGLYGLGMLIMLILQLKEFWNMNRILAGGSLSYENDGVKLVRHSNDSQSPFSWMNYIVLSESDYKSCGEEILMHERAHIKHRHSLDMLFANVVIALQWFNPVAWLFKQELEIVHEYQADAYVLKHGVNAQNYQILLIKKSVGDYMFNLANSFNHRHLTKRIHMMLTKKSNRWALLKVVYLVPILFLVAFVMGCSNTDTTAKDTIVKAEEQAENVIVKDSKDETDTEVVFVAEEMPEFPGGMKELMNYLNENIQYPVEAAKQGIQGRVVVKFVVNKDGSIADLEVLRGVESSLDKEAIRVIKAMPKWEPGKVDGKNVNVKYTIPVTFRLK